MLSFLSPAGFGTQRLTLRALKPTDAAQLFSTYTSNLDVARYLPWKLHQSQSETEAMVLHSLDPGTMASAYLLAIAVRGDDETPIGLLNLAESENGASIGFGLARPYWGKGFGSEIISSVKNWLLVQPSIWRVWGYCDEENEGSARVMTQAGMQLEGTLRRYETHPNLAPEPRTCHIFASVRE